MRDARIQSLHRTASSERGITRVSEQPPASAGGQILQQHGGMVGERSGQHARNAGASVVGWSIRTQRCDPETATARGLGMRWPVTSRACPRAAALHAHSARSQLADRDEIGPRADQNVRLLRLDIAQILPGVLLPAHRIARFPPWPDNGRDRRRCCCGAAAAL